MRRKVAGIVLALGMMLPVTACGADQQPTQVVYCDDDDDCGPNDGYYEDREDDD